MTSHRGPREEQGIEQLTAVEKLVVGAATFTLERLAGRVNPRGAGRTNTHDYTGNYCCAADTALK